MFAAKTNTHQYSPNSQLFGGGFTSFVQPKLNVGKPEDKYEVEADKAADQIVAKSKEPSQSFFSPTPIVQKQNDEEIQSKEIEETTIQEKPVVEQISPLIQRQTSEDEEVLQAKCSACASEEKLQKKETTETLSKVQMKVSGESHTIQKCGCDDKDTSIQRKEESGEDKQSSLNIALQQMQSNKNFESKLAKNKGKGSKLDQNTQTEMEAGFGADFSEVRIHNDSEATQMSQDIGAQAFTHGNDIYFNQGKYNPNSEEGKHLLAHELTHTIHQGASSTYDIQRFELPGFVESGLDTVGNLYDNTVDTVANGMYEVGEALGVNDEILAAYEMAEDVYDAATEYLIKAKDWLLTTAGQAARALVEALGGTMDVTEEGIIITFPETCPVEAETFDIEIPAIEQDLLYPLVFIPVVAGVIDGAFIGSAGLKLTMDPEMSMQLGPFCLTGARLVINPLTGNFSVEGGISATAGVSMGAEARGGVKADIGFMGVAFIGGAPLPINISLVSIEGGAAGIVRGIGMGRKTLEGSLGYSNGSLVMNSSDQLDIGLAADFFLGLYGQLDIGGFNFCRLYWDLFEWHGDIGAMFLNTTNVVIGPNPSFTKETTAEMGEFPFTDLEMHLGRGGFEDDCPLIDMLCWLADTFDHLPSKNDGTWENYGQGGLLDPEDPKQVHKRDPKRASGAKCRGACGEDCKTCDSYKTYRYTDEDTGIVWKYTNFEDCPTHKGCRDHDAGFDWAADKKGESKKNEGVIPSFLKYWHMMANLECACNYEMRECVGWVNGKPPHDEEPFYFADSVEKVTGDSEKEESDDDGQDTENGPDCSPRSSPPFGDTKVGWQGEDFYHYSKEPVSGDFTVRPAYERWTNYLTNCSEEASVATGINNNIRYITIVTGEDAPQFIDTSQFTNRRRRSIVWDGVEMEYEHYNNHTVIPESCYSTFSMTIFTPDCEPEGADEDDGDLEKKIEAINVFFYDKDPEKHRLFIEIEDGEAEIMMQSDTTTVQNAINVKEDANPTEEEKAYLEIAESFRAQIDKEVEKHLKKYKGNEGEQETESIVDKIQKKLEELGEYLEEAGVDYFPELPPSKVTHKLSDGKPLYVKADPLTLKPGNTVGYPPKDNPAGWELVQMFKYYRAYIDPTKKKGEGRLVPIVTPEDEANAEGKTIVRTTNWIRFHMLNENLHGPGLFWNLLSSSSKDNSKYLRDIEEQVKTAVLTNKHIYYFNVSVKEYRKISDMKDVNKDKAKHTEQIKELYTEIPEKLEINAWALKEKPDKTFEPDESVEPFFKAKPFKFDDDIDVSLAPGEQVVILLYAGRKTLGKTFPTALRTYMRSQRGVSKTVEEFVNNFFTGKSDTSIATVLPYLKVIVNKLETSNAAEQITLFENGNTEQEIEELNSKILDLGYIGFKYSGNPLLRPYVDKGKPRGERGIGKYLKTLPPSKDFTIEGIKFNIKRPGVKMLFNAVRTEDPDKGPLVPMSPLKNYYMLDAIQQSP